MLKVLWINNIEPPDYSNHMNHSVSVYGGWLNYSAKLLSTDADIELGFAFPGNKGESNQYVSIGKSRYFPFNVNEKKSIKTTSKDSILRTILIDFNPNIVHINGTEFRHSYLFSKFCIELNIPFVVSIQGLVSEYTHHFYANLQNHEFFIPTIKDLLRKTSVKRQQKSFYNRGIIEMETLKVSRNFIGRTDWDFRATRLYSKHSKYFHLPELLREDFYKTSKWNYSLCKKNTIFVTQASYPIKGFHILLDAVEKVLKYKEDLKVFVAGPNFDSYPFYRRTGYQKFILKKIKKLNLKKHIVFLGELSTTEIINNFKKCNLFISPSSIDNSPNSVSEALYLNVPTIASYVGGVPSLVKDSNAVLYQYDSSMYLASVILERLDSNNQITNNEFNMKYDPQKYKSKLISIYTKIIGD